jgi:hypothetical protein
VVSNEVFFFGVLILVFFAYRYKPLLGYLTCFFFIGASIIIIFAETFAYDYTYTSKDNRWELGLIKITPVNSIASYLVGVLYGLIWFSYQNQGDAMHCRIGTNNLYRKLMNSKALRITLMTFSFLFMLLVIYLPYPIYNKSSGTIKQVFSSILLSIERPCFAVGLAFFLLPCILGKAGIFRVIFGNRLFVPLARLNSSALLVHGLILMWYFFGKFQIIRLDPSVLNLAFIALALLSYIIALIFSLFFESPFITMENLLWCPTKKRMYNQDEVSRSSEGSVELSIAKQDIADKCISDKVTNDSRKGSDLAIPMLIDNDSMEKVDKNFRKSNSLGTSEEIDKIMNNKNGLLNESESSHNYPSVHEPRLTENK